MIGMIFHPKASANHGANMMTCPLIGTYVGGSGPLFENVEKILALFSGEARRTSCVRFRFQGVFPTFLKGIFPSFNGRWSSSNRSGDLSNPSAFGQHAGSKPASRF
jgi:hypothetical protein